MTSGTVNGGEAAVNAIAALIVFAHGQRRPVGVVGAGFFTS
jgi:hypothetical protein